MILIAVVLNNGFYVKLLWFFSNLPTTQGPNAKCVRVEAVLGLLGTINGLCHLSAGGTEVLLDFVLEVCVPSGDKHVENEVQR